MTVVPELPDVEGFRRVLAEHASGRRIRDVEVRDAGVVRAITPEALREQLVGRRFGAPWRHGKWLVTPTDGPTLLLHFGMTGALLWCPKGEARHRHDRVVFVLDDGELRYRDTRKLQGLWVSPGAADDLLADLGPDALAVRWPHFDRRLSGRRGAVKAALVDQRLLAGLGNLLADEILWRARIHPRRQARDMPVEERRRLYEEMRRVLRAAVRAGRIPARPGWLTGVRDDTAGRCPRCGTPLSRGRVGGRGTVWCPRCQQPD